MARFLPLAALLAIASPAVAQDELFDLHVHIWEGEKSVREYEAQLAETGQQVTRFGAIHMAVQGKVAETRAKNDELIALARKYPKLLPIPSVHPYDGDAALAELARLAALGVRAIKLHPHTQKFDVTDPRVRALCEAAGKHGLVVLVDNASIVPGDNQKLFNLAIDVPGTRFIFTHMGGLDFRFWNTIAFLRTTQGLFSDNINFDISATVQLVADSPIAEEFVWTMRNVGIDHVLLGSDYPQMTLANAARALDRLKLTPEERQKVRWANAKALLLDPLGKAPALKSRQPLKAGDR